MEGFLDSTVFDLELPRSSAFANRYDFWVELLVIEIDQLNSTNDVQEMVGSCVKYGARVEDALYRINDTQFLVKSLSRHSKGILVLADRYKDCVEKQSHGAITISCGAISYWPGLRMPSSEVKDFLYSQLELAQQNGGHQVQHQTIDVIFPVCEKVVDID